MCVDAAVLGLGVGVPARLELSLHIWLKSRHRIRVRALGLRICTLLRRLACLELDTRRGGRARLSRHVRLEELPITTLGVQSKVSRPCRREVCW